MYITLHTIMSCNGYDNSNDIFYDVAYGMMLVFLSKELVFL